MGIKLYYVYILTNAYNKVLYTGVTNNLERRCYEHKHKIVKGFTQKYNVDKLVILRNLISLPNLLISCFLEYDYHRNLVCKM
jgi:predicted GIY-YIG superfamily endonuclease